MTKQHFWLRWVAQEVMMSQWFDKKPFKSILGSFWFKAKGDPLKNVQILTLCRVWSCAECEPIQSDLFRVWLFTEFGAKSVRCGKLVHCVTLCIWLQFVLYVTEWSVWPNAECDQLTILKDECAEGGAHLPIAHALRLPEPTKTNKSEGACSSASLRSFGRPQIWKYVHGKRKNNA